MFSALGTLAQFLCLQMLFIARYAIHVIPWLLDCFSDGVMAVREATEMAAKTIMGQLTGQGVKLVLPALLKVSFG